jgi:hypothetical protein
LSTIGLGNSVLRSAVPIQGWDADSPVFLTAAVLIPGSAIRAGLNYRAAVARAKDSDLTDLLDKAFELKTLENKPPHPKRRCAGETIVISGGSRMPLSEVGTNREDRGLWATTGLRSASGKTCFNSRFPLGARCGSDFFF